MAENIVSPEEQAEETSAQAEVKAEEVRKEIVTEFGFDEAKDKDKIDKLTTKTVESRKQLSKTIGQKVKWRTEANKPKSAAVDPMPPVDIKTPPVDVEETVLRANGMDVALLKELKDVAALRKVSLLEAQKDPLFVRAKEMFEKEQKSKDAGAGGSRGSGGKQSEKSAATPGLTAAEHKAIWKAKTGFNA